MPGRGERQEARPTLETPPDLEVLLRASPVALFLDFDGTLVELAERPDAISVPVELNARLVSLCARLGQRLALVSGRSVGDLEHHLGPLELARAGSHGVARLLADGAMLGGEPEQLSREASAAIRDFARDHGFELEEKPHGMALHYRSTPHLESRGLDFVEDLAESHGLQVKRGKCVIELVRPGADKGAAVRAFMEVPPFRGAVPVFVGDDLTDEDGFAAASELGGFGILVGERPSTAARYRLADAAAVHDWLRL